LANHPAGRRAWPQRPSPSAQSAQAFQISHRQRFAFVYDPQQVFVVQICIVLRRASNMQRHRV
ncbi:hypothetical protein, partial [Comamonas sp.]|uniref:hypothetical protein n=1 Tax=Comamonas sp. TaxID=34028 RepID=UPI00289982A7